MSESKIHANETEQTSTTGDLKKLNDFIDQSYLTHMYSRNGFAVYLFLNKLYLGFSTNQENPENPVGYALTPTEAELLKCSPEITFFKIFDSGKKDFLVFTEELLLNCASGKGRRKILKPFKDLGFSFKKTCVVSSEDFQEIPHRLLYEILILQYDKKISATEKYVAHLKRLKKVIKTLAIFAVITAVSATARHLTKLSSPNEETAVFQKNGATDVYSSVEIDFLVPFVNTESHEYYLYGNSQTKEYGIVEFIDEYKYNVSFDSEMQTFNQPIVLYGETSSLPYYVSIQKEEKPSTNDYSFNNSMVLPDGTTVMIPNQTPEISQITPDYGFDTENRSQKALEIFSENLFDLGDDADLGEVYLWVYNEPLKEYPAIYTVFTAICAISLMSSTVLALLVFLLAVLGSGVESAIVHIHQGNFAASILEEIRNDPQFPKNE